MGRMKVNSQKLGTIGELETGWSVSMPSSPTVISNGAGPFGSVSFSAETDNTSKFAIDNYATARHLNDDGTLGLGGFDGNIRSVNKSLSKASFGMNSLLSVLDLDVTTAVDASGTLESSFVLPDNKPYVESSVTYYTQRDSLGNPYTSSRVIDIAGDDLYVYYLVTQYSGSGGEVVYVMDRSGNFINVFTTRQGASTGGNGLAIFAAGGFVYVTQNANQVQKFTRAGVLSTYWGASGTGNGQFNFPTDVVADASNVYVLDRSNGRIQKFSLTGTYVTQWGTAGSGAGNLVFNAPNRIALDPGTGNIFLNDGNTIDGRARIRVYSNTGTYLGTLLDGGSSGPGNALGQRTLHMGFDQRGNLYGVQRTDDLTAVNEYKWYRPVAYSAAWVTAQNPNKTWAWAYPNGGNNIVTGSGFAPDGTTYISGQNVSIRGFTGSLGTTEAYVRYYVGLASPTLKINLQSVLSVTADYIAWSGNIWSRLNELAAATGNTISLVNDVMQFFDRRLCQFKIPNDGKNVTESNVDLESRSSGQNITIVNYNSAYVMGTLYDASADNNRTINIDVNGLSYLSVNGGTYPEFINQPIPSTGNIAAPGTYFIYDSTSGGSLPVDPTQWTNYGGSITSAIDYNNPGAIILTVKGPGVLIPGTVGPYQIQTVAGQAAFSLTGYGVKATTETYRIGTGVDPLVTRRDVALQIDSPFVYNAATAYTAGSWAAYNSGTPSQSVQFTFDLDAVNAANLSLVAGSILPFDDAQYVIETVNWNWSSVTVQCYRYTPWGQLQTNEPNKPRPQDIWYKKTCAEFEAFWQGYVSQDFTIAPCRNPFGV